MAKKILILDTGKEWGGGTNSLLELLKRNDRNKYCFSVLFYNNYKQGKESDIKTEIEKLGTDFLLLEQKKQPSVAKILKEIVRLMFFFRKRLKKHCIFLIDYHFKIKKNAERIAEILRNLKIDLLYMNNQPSSNLEGIVASKMINIPVLQHSRIETKLNFFEVKAANQGLSKIICVSEGVKNEFVKQGVVPSMCQVVYNGISSETKPQISPQEIKMKWGISDNDILIGTVGSLLKRKRIKDLIEALCIITSKIDYSIKCLIVGEGPERDNLFELVKRKNLRDRVIFSGFQTDAISYINAMDILVMTSEKEGLPRVILEAMLMQKPVIAPRIAGITELIIDKKTGLLFQKDNLKEFAEYLANLLLSPSLRKDMGRAGKKRVVENFSIEKYVNQVSSILSKVAG